MVFEKHEHHTDGSESWILTVQGKGWKVIQRADQPVRLYSLSGVAAEEMKGVDAKAAAMQIERSLDLVMMECRLLAIKMGRVQ
jgi:hypothetical protein